MREELVMKTLSRCNGVFESASVFCCESGKGGAVDEGGSGLAATEASLNT
jgi:hypothetical protein